MRTAAIISMAACALLSVACGGADVPTCDSYCQYKLRTQEACERNDGESCYAAASFSLGDRDALVVKACELGHGPACTDAGDAAVDLFRPKKDEVERAFAYFIEGCSSGEAKACAAGARLLLIAHRETELRGFVSAPCERGDQASCRELGKSLAFGIGGDVDAARGAELLGSACAADDPEACAVLAFMDMTGRHEGGDAASARARLEASCTAGAKKSCTLAKLTEPGATSSLAVVLARHPITVVHASGVVPPQFARAMLSVGGPFEIGPLSFSWFGLLAGPIIESSPGRLVFHGDRMNIVNMLWAPGDLVLVSWPKPQPEAEAGHCEQDSDCRKRGFCTLRDGYCLRASDADCARLDDCLGFGRCRFDAGECLASEAGCAASRACKDHGDCRPDESGRWCRK